MDIDIEKSIGYKYIYIDISKIIYLEYIFYDSYDDYYLSNFYFSYVYKNNMIKYYTLLSEDRIIISTFEICKRFNPLKKIYIYGYIDIHNYDKFNFINLCDYLNTATPNNKKYSYLSHNASIYSIKNINSSRIYKSINYII